MRSFCLALAFLILVALMPAFAFAGRTELPVQGYILDTNTGDPINASLPMTFKVYEDCESDTVLWSVRKIIDFEFGLYSTTIEPDEDIILENEDLCLGITIADDNEMNPRLEYHAVPYTVLASQADYAEIAGIALDIDENNLPGMVGAGLVVSNHEINLDTTYSQTWTGVQTYNSQVIVSKSPTTTSSSDAAFKINPTEAVTGAKTFVIQDNGSDTFSVNKEGDVVIAGNLTVTGQLNLSAVGDITSVNAGNGLSGGALFDDANLAVDQSYAFAWTGLQTFGALTTFNTDVDYVFAGSESLSLTNASVAADQFSLLTTVADTQTADVLQISITDNTSTSGNARGLVVETGD
ncbi:MAG: hypothetical protein ACD_73C00738G0003, partial [uncultured bacterium]